MPRRLDLGKSCELDGAPWFKLQCKRVSAEAALLEVFDALAEPFADVRNAASTKEQQRDERDDNELRCSE